MLDNGHFGFQRRFGRKTDDPSYAVVEVVLVANRAAVGVEFELIRQELISRPV